MEPETPGLRGNAILSRPDIVGDFSDIRMSRMLFDAQKVRILNNFL